MKNGSIALGLSFVFLSIAPTRADADEANLDVIERITLDPLLEPRGWRARVLDVSSSKQSSLQALELLRVRLWAIARLGEPADAEISADREWRRSLASVVDHVVASRHVP
jgi:hypothetical protein